MTATFQIEIPRRNHDCVACQSTFLAGMQVFSAIEDGEEGETIRKDYCHNCWQQLDGEIIKGMTHWKSRVPIKPEKRQDLGTREEQAMLLLLKALQDDSDDAASEAFILALYLTRRRKLAMRKEKAKDGCVFCLYEVLETEEMLPVKKVDLSFIQVAQVQQSIADKLQAQEQQENS